MINSSDQNRNQPKKGYTPKRDQHQINNLFGIKFERQMKKKPEKMDVRNKFFNFKLSMWSSMSPGYEKFHCC